MTLEQIIQNAINDESERNGNTRNHDFSKYCSCGFCHSSSISAQALLARIKEIVPGKKLCGSCKGTGKFKDTFGDEMDCPHCYVIYQWNKCRDQINKNIEGLMGEVE